MKSKSYKNHRECPICKQIFPLTREFFMRYGSNTGYHQICRTCEKQLNIEQEWHNNLLLCHDCLQYKDENEFSAHGSNSVIRHNRRHICRTCATIRQRKHDVNLEDAKKLEKCLRWRFLGARDRAIRQSLPFDLDLQYILDLWNQQNGICALSGIPMTYELKQGRIPTNISIDKINGELGYIKGNIQLVCMACNQIKSDLTEVEMYKFCKNIVQHYEDKNNFSSEK